MDFSMVPVGATNVGGIVVNFDKDLKTNDIMNMRFIPLPLQ